MEVAEKLRHKGGGEGHHHCNQYLATSILPAPPARPKKGGGAGGGLDQGPPESPGSVPPGWEGQSPVWLMVDSAGYKGGRSGPPGQQQHGAGGCSLRPLPPPPPPGPGVAGPWPGGWQGAAPGTPTLAPAGQPGPGAAAPVRGLPAGKHAGPSPQPPTLCPNQTPPTAPCPAPVHSAPHPWPGPPPPQASSPPQTGGGGKFPTGEGQWEPVPGALSCVQSQHPRPGSAGGAGLRCPELCPFSAPRAPQLWQQHGAVFTLWMGPRPTVVLCGHRALRQALLDHGEAMAGRPHIPAQHLVSRGYGERPRRGCGSGARGCWRQ